MKTKFGDDLNALFKLPLTEFIGARKELAARLKREGRGDEAERVKLLSKPPISAWTVNQLYWRRRNEFEELLATGQRFRKAQTSGKVAEMRDALDARRESLSELSDLATELLTDAGHNASLDMLRRITTTLEAISAFASPSDGPTPGQLTQDVDPPGFDSFAGFVASAATTKVTKEPPKLSSSKKPDSAAVKAREKIEATRLEKTRQARIGVAKIALQNAKKSLSATKVKTESLAAAKKKVDAAVKEAEKESRQAEERFKKAKSAFENAEQRAQTITAEAAEASKALENAKRAVDQATKDLESLFSEAL